MSRDRVRKIERLIIGDVDGVVANPGSRLDYLIGEKEWDKFYGAEMANDKYISLNGELLHLLAESPQSQLLFLTGRPERTQELTRLWLNEHFGKDIDWWIEHRKDGDHRKSSVVKAEMLERFLIDYESIIDSDMVIYIFDDDPKNVLALEEVVNYLRFGYKYETYIVGTERLNEGERSNEKE